MRFEEQADLIYGGSLAKSLTVAHGRKPNHLNQLPNRTREAGAEEARHASQSRVGSAESNSPCGL